MIVALNDKQRFFMKYFFLIAILFSFDANAQFTSNVYWTEQTSMPSGEIIYYNVQKPLVWNDFKGIPILPLQVNCRH